MSTTDHTPTRPTRRLVASDGDVGELVLGRYRLDHRLGAGGFGVVWRAHDVRLERDVAVKAIPREEGDVEHATREHRRARVEREALAAARLNHPGIVGLYELGADDDHVYLVSELVEGATLAALIREGAVADRDVARIGQALCEALEHAHARGVVHRDVKPANVMVLAEPAAGAGFAKLTDFGIAHLVSGDDLTATGDVLGTLAYMAPEQAEGWRITGAADVYSLALCLYEAWTGWNPVRGESPAETARRLGGWLPGLGSRRPDLPPELCEVIDAALVPDPRDRPPPLELREVLTGVAGNLSDDGGLVEPETIQRFGLTAVRAPAARSGRSAARLGRSAARSPNGRAPDPFVFAPRLAAGAAAGLLVLAGLALGPAPPVAPSAVAAVVALAVALLPRIGWLCAAVTICGWLATPEAGQAGTALVLAVALAPIPLLLPRAGVLWSAPAIAPLLGAIALAPLFVGLAALVHVPGRPRARGIPRRAGLAIAGFLWLAAAEVLTGSTLLFGTAEGTLPREGWEGSVVDAAADGLAPLLSSPALAPALVWAAFALVLPLLARGRFAALDLTVAAVWIAGLVAAHDGLGDLLAATTELQRTRGAVAGAALGGLVAVTVILLAPRRGDGPREPALP